MAGYRTSSTDRCSRWISSMNRTSPCWRSVSRAARSPARTRTGPDVTRSPTPISAATIPASEVLPSPGRPGEQQVVDRLPRVDGPPRARCSRCSVSWAWPRNSSRLPRPEPGLFGLLGRVGRGSTGRARPVVGAAASSAAGSAAPSSWAAASARPEPPGGLPASPGGQLAQGLAQQLLHGRPRRAGRRAPGGSRRARSRARPARPGPRRGRSGPGRPPVTAAAEKSGSSRRALQVDAAAGPPSCGRRPGPSTASSRSSSSTAVDSAAGESADRTASASDGPDPVGAEQRLEAPALVVVGEAVEDDGVLADVGVDVQEDLATRPRRWRPAAASAPTPGSPTPADLDDDLGLGRPGHEAAPQRPDHVGASARGRRGDGSAERQRRQVADRQGQGVGHVGGPGHARPRPSTGPPSAVPGPWWRCRSRPGPASPRWTCTAPTSQPASAAATRASPLACPTGMAVRTLIWKNTRSTTTAVGPDTRPPAPAARLDGSRAVRGSAACGSVSMTPAAAGGQRRRRRRPGDQPVAAPRQARVDAQDEHAFDSSVAVTSAG